MEKIIQDSNISDLLDDSLKQRPTHTSTGYEYFAKGLGQINVPRNSVGNQGRLQSPKGVTPKRKTSVGKTSPFKRKTRKVRWLTTDKQSP